MKDDIFFDKLPAPLKDDLLYEYIEKAHNGDQAAKETIILHNMRLVKHIAYKFNNTPYDSEELMSIGYIALIKAIDTFDTKKRVKFVTYSARCIYNEILMFMRKEKKYMSNVSLNECLKSDYGRNKFKFEDTLIDEKANFVEEIEIYDTYKLIRKLVNELPDRDKEIVQLYFGFTTNKVYTQMEIAQKFNISQSAVAKLIKKNVKNIKKELIKLEPESIYLIGENTVKHKEDKGIPRRLKSIYEYFTEYSKEEVNEVISKLSDDEKELLYARYGNDLENPIKADKFEFYRNKFYRYLLPKMKAMLELKSNKESLELNNTLQNKEDTSIKDNDNFVDKKSHSLSMVESINKDDYIKILDMMKKLKFNDVFNYLSVKEAIIVGLRLGYIDNKYFSTKSIADFLGIEEEEVIEITKKVLLLYKENINDFIDKTIEITTEFQYVKNKKN